jgi:hypothetical protein
MYRFPHSEKGSHTTAERLFAIVFSNVVAFDCITMCRHLQRAQQICQLSGVNRQRFLNVPTTRKTDTRKIDHMLSCCQKPWAD